MNSASLPAKSQRPTDHGRWLERLEEREPGEVGDAELVRIGEERIGAELELEPVVCAVEIRVPAVGARAVRAPVGAQVPVQLAEVEQAVAVGLRVVRVGAHDVVLRDSRFDQERVLVDRRVEVAEVEWVAQVEAAQLLAVCQAVVVRVAIVRVGRDEAIADERLVLGRIEVLVEHAPAW